MLFFYMGFEHSIVNMFLFPSGLLLGADFTIGDYLGGTRSPPCSATSSAALSFVGLTMYWTHAKTRVSAAAREAHPHTTDIAVAEPAKVDVTR